MCLTLEWFSGKPERIRKWDANGLSINEAEIALDEYHTSCYPIATEMAEYIFQNWTARRVAFLSSAARRVLFEIWDEEIYKKENEKLENLLKDSEENKKGTIF
jgi:hypothetical protein